MTAATEDGSRTDPVDEIRRELAAAGSEAESLARGLAPEQLWWQPAEGWWSVGECLDHLVRTGEVYLEVIDEGIEAARRRGLEGSPPFRRTWIGRWFERYLEPPPGLKVPAPGRIRPRPAAGATPEVADAEGDPLRRFLALRPRFERRLAAAEGLDLGRARVRSPFVPLLRVDLESAFRMVTAHERRHLWQARRVTEQERFPAG